MSYDNYCAAEWERYEAERDRDAQRAQCARCVHWPQSGCQHEMWAESGGCRHFEAALAETAETEGVIE